MSRITLPARIDSLGTALEMVDNEICRANPDDRLRNNIAVVFEEVFVNVASYAYPDGGGSVTVSVDADPAGIRIEVRDFGKPFNPLKKPDPDTSLPAEKREIGGLGIFLVKQFMDRAEYRHENNENILIMEKTMARAEDGSG